MNPSPPRPAVSDWPIGLLLDELWLRSRRTLVHELERSGFWLETERYRTIMAAQLARGNALRGRILGSVLGPEDFRLLASESMFASANHRFRTRLPLCLAFGYEVGLGFSGAPDDGQEELLRTCELAALFNLGIATFDLLYDTMPNAAAAFSSRFNPEVLARLGRQAPVGDRMAAVEGLDSQPEIRLLLRIIECFFSRLHAVAPTPEHRRVAARWLTLAYRAEMASIAADHGRAGTSSISQRKSLLPFRVIRIIVSSTRPASADSGRALDRLATDVGTLFWLVDDLADVVDDIRCGALNSIGLERRRNGNSAVAPAVRTLLESRAIERCVRRVTLCGEAIGARCRSPAFAGSATARLPELLAAYVRSWIE